MAHEYLEPEGLFSSRNFGFSQVVKAHAGHAVYCSGQGAIDANFKIVGGDDVGAQAEQALANLGLALAAAGATPADLTSLRIYVVDYQAEHMSPIGAALSKFLDGGDPPAQTLIGVQALGLPEMRVEIESTAVVAE